MRLEIEAVVPIARGDGQYDYEVAITLNGEPLSEEELAEAAAFVECVRRGWHAEMADDVHMIGTGNSYYTAESLTEALSRALEATGE